VFKAAPNLYTLSVILEYHFEVALYTNLNQRSLKSLKTPQK